MFSKVEKGKNDKITVYPLSELIRSQNSEEDTGFLSELLSSFSCEKDKDIEFFLHNNAIRFEKLNKSRTYLLCDSDSLNEKGEFVILGYFSTALKVLDLPDHLSNRRRKEMDGLSAKLHGEVIRSVPCYLIGQLAKNSNISGECAIKGSELIDYALTIIQYAETLVGGRFVMIECRNTPKLLDFYAENRFKKFDEFPHEDSPMVQMVRTLCDAEF